MCGAAAPFGWMGGVHDCDATTRSEQPLLVSLPDPEMAHGFPCGNAVRTRVVMESWVEGDELAHLTRYMERVRDDDDATEMRVVVRGDGSLQFFAPDCIYSAPVGAAE
ncbi:hypothetical protein CRI77_16020 [Mycolicibacterium duvalii]|uniref:Uncharacterized protein n=2 Tax=Mycolicibacterium duvalii TaxID=39688 RepID=A0A7I7K3J6_9MYCO|nr:hypothetical protein CRI77_16020 [Mycolicibacterium duvalii]BBX18647.1 hypothetical protein MDUV_35070 [Mycolicibacterium duvalii]